MLPPKSNYKTILFLALIIQSLVLTAPVFGSIVDRVVAKVNNEIITLSTVKSKAALFLSRIDPSDSDSVKLTEKQLMQQSLDSIIDEKLKVQEGKKIGLIVNEETINKAIADIYKNNNITANQFKLILEKEGRDFASYKKNIHDQILSSKVVKMHFQGAQLASNRDTFKYYKVNKKKYWVPNRVVISQIMFITGKDLSKSDVELKKKKAREILGLLRSGKDFSGLAKKYSEDISGPLGGRVGIIERGITLPKFEEIAFNLKLNEVSNVFQTENGIHIIRCDDIISGYFKSYKDVKAEIKGLLDFEKRGESYIAWMKELRETAFIEVKLFEKTIERQSVNKDNEKIVDKVRSNKYAKKISARLKPKPARLDINQKSIEAKLRYLKKLRNNGKISNQKYLEKKKILLRKF
jgi:peptidyl-prolyl cis-trans isomerase SurA